MARNEPGPNQIEAEVRKMEGVISVPQGQGNMSGVQPGTPAPQVPGPTIKGGEVGPKVSGAPDTLPGGLLAGDVNPAGHGKDKSGVSANLK